MRRMNVRYQEHPPPAHLASYVECFWTMRTAEDHPAYPVLPDGCVDIVFSRGGPRDGLQVVGAMTRPHKFALASGQFQLGVRFRPAMSYSFLRIPGPEIRDAAVPLSDHGRSEVHRMAPQLAEAPSVRECIQVMADQLPEP